VAKTLPFFYIKVYHNPQFVTCTGEDLATGRGRLTQMLAKLNQESADLQNNIRYADLQNNIRYDTQVQVTKIILMKV
jgi:hypothetical protein